MGSVNSIITLSSFSTANIWGPAHEVGHVNQVRPGMRWDGMVEVTNNIYSMYVQTAFGNQSRLVGSTYNNAFNNFLGKDLPHRVTISGFDVFGQLVPFWQLKLYLHDVLGKTDFYPDLFYDYITNPNPGTSSETDGRFQLHFVRTACKIANLNLIYFFEQWGFLTPVDTGSFRITQAQIDALKTEIAGKNYPLPARDFTRITDQNVNSYR